MTGASMRQIADSIGVSKMTVSRALKNHPHVSADLRTRINEMAAKIGYRPHPYVSALMSGLAQTRRSAASVNLALFHFDPVETIFPHTYYTGVCERARSLGYNVVPFHYQPARVTPARLRSILVARSIRGIILMPAPEGFTSLDFDFTGFACAALGHTIVHPPLPRVAGDIYSGTIKALNRLTGLGYTRIGMINTDYVNRLGNFLYSAALSTYRDHVAPGFHLVEHFVAEPIHAPDSLDRMKTWILREKLNAVICPVFGFPLHEILLGQGFQIPVQLAYLHLLDYPDPHVSCLDQMGTLIGSKAVDLVVAMINRNEFNPPEYPHTVNTPSRWHEGLTTPALTVPANAPPVP